jgi:hypothetical protein
VQPTDRSVKNRFIERVVVSALLVPRSTSTLCTTYESYDTMYSDHRYQLVHFHAAYRILTGRLAGWQQRKGTCVLQLRHRDTDNDRRKLACTIAGKEKPRQHLAESAGEVFAQKAIRSEQWPCRHHSPQVACTAVKRGEALRHPASLAAA